MEELLGRKTPHSAPAEQAVVGSMLIDPRCIPDVLERLKGDEFYIKLNRDIYETMAAMFAYGQTIDPVTVLDQMKIRGVYDDSCDSYMAEVMRITPTASNVMEYAAIVRDRALLRRLSKGAVNLYAQECSKLAEGGAVELHADDGYAILLNEKLYSDECGLEISSEGGEGFFA